MCLSSPPRPVCCWPSLRAATGPRLSWAESPRPRSLQVSLPHRGTRSTSPAAAAHPLPVLNASWILPRSLTRCDLGLLFPCGAVSCPCPWPGAHSVGEREASGVPELPPACASRRPYFTGSPTRVCRNRWPRGSPRSKGLNCNISYGRLSSPSGSEGHVAFVTIAVFRAREMKAACSSCPVSGLKGNAFGFQPFLFTFIMRQVKSTQRSHRDCIE